MNTNDEIIGPSKTTLVDVGLLTAGAFIAGFIGGFLLLIFMLFFSQITQVNYNSLVGGYQGGLDESTFFPLVLSFVIFIISFLVAIFSYFILSKIDEEKYSMTLLYGSQIGFFSFIIYLLFLPIYLYTGTRSIELLMFVFIAHIIVQNFGTLLIVGILNNYRYILLSIYSSFFGVFINAIIMILLFNYFSDGEARLIILILVIPLSNGFMVLFKGIFDFLYYRYFLATGKDQLGDIFEQIRAEELEALQDAMAQSNTY